MIADIDQVIGWYSNGVRQIVKSSRSSAASTGTWYRRSGVVQDPYISLGLHPDGMVYLENSLVQYNTFIQNNKGMKVFIRQAPIRADDTDSCL